MRSHVWGQEWGLGGPCLVRFNASWVMVTWDPLTPLLNRMTNTTENITFLQLRWPEVIIYRNVKNYKINTDSNLVLALRLLFLGGTGGVISAAFCPCDTVGVPST